MVGDGTALSDGTVLVVVLPWVADEVVLCVEASGFQPGWGAGAECGGVGR